MLLSIALKSLFFILGCVTTTTVIYTIVTDGSPFRKELLTPWMATGLVDFYINVVAIGAWVVYKEANRISALFWIILLVCFGSIATSGYIVLQLFKLSSKESSDDPIYFVLRRSKKREAENKTDFSVASARLFFGALFCLMLGASIYTYLTDGSPFRKDVFTPWFFATLMDLGINVVAISTWAAYKEPSWFRGVFWIIVLICTGGVGTCWYIVLKLFHLSPDDSAHDVLFE